MVGMSHSWVILGPWERRADLEQCLSTRATSNIQARKSSGTARGALSRGDVRLDKLGNITEELNNAFGLSLTERASLIFEQLEVSWLADDQLHEIAKANDLDGLRLEFEKTFERTVLTTKRRTATSTSGSSTTRSSAHELWTGTCPGSTSSYEPKRSSRSYHSALRSQRPVRWRSDRPAELPSAE